MRTVIIAILLLPLLAKEGVGGWSHEDDSIFKVRVQSIREIYPKAGENLIVEIGKLFLGTPYVGGTLDRDPSKEYLVVDLHEFDCVTFYETTLALYRASVLSTYDGSKSSPPNAVEYSLEHELQQLRYRHGDIAGYPSRLHYTTDYFYDAEKKGLLRNVTRTIGGAYVKNSGDKAIDFMSTHRSLYKQLASNDSNYAAIVRMEKAIRIRGPFSYIPKEHIEHIEQKIQSGDILGITTNLPGLDCSHTGIAIRMSDGRIHFLHASSLAGKVIISDEPLAEYLTHSSHQTGIIVMQSQSIGLD